MPVAFHTIECLPASTTPDINVLTSLPRISKIFSVAIDLEVKVNVIVVDGLNGLG